ncbi:MAG: glycosyltransferase family 4 protein [Methanomicrobiales archaeon]|nr:glycosyltransferase family 4 protein [Methanomicrobiales archaeon]
MGVDREEGGRSLQRGERLRIAYFVDEFPPFFRGGLGTYAMEITRQFVRGGHTVTVFSRNNGSDPTRDIWEGVEVHRPLLMDMSDVLSILNQGDVRRWDEGGQRFYQETLLYNFLSASKLVNNLVPLEKRAFDVIISHDWLSAPGGIVAKRNLSRPFVFHFHSTEEGRTSDGSETVKQIERLAAEHADLIVTVSYAMRDELIRLGYQEAKIRVVYNGVDPRKYDPERFPEEEISRFRNAMGAGDDPMIFFIGRLTWVKGIDMLLMAMPTIVREFPEAKLVILGKGDMEPLITHIIYSLHLEKNVITNFSYVSEEERLKYYAACDIAVFPSKYEPFGIVCTEAMAMGKPVVVGARGTSGLREQVVVTGPGQNGFHINPFDPEDIAKFTLLLLNDRDLRRRFGANGRRRVLEQFTWEKVSDATIKVYEEAIERHHGRAPEVVAG